MVRKMAAAGKFYPRSSKELDSYLEDMLADVEERSAKTFGGLVPHAGYKYSGQVAAEFFGSINRTPETFLILGPNHTGRGQEISLSSQDWETPLGKVPVDEKLEREIHNNTRAEFDEGGHHYEHSIEVQVPFLQKTCSEDFEILPISIGQKEKGKMINLGEGILEAIKKLNRDVIVITSSDLMHYGSRYGYIPFPENDVPEKVEELDQELLEIIMGYDIESMYEWIEERGYTMCGYGSTATMITVLKDLIPEKKRSKMLSYDTSFSFMEEPASVVGYGALTFEGK